MPTSAWDSMGGAGSPFSTDNQTQAQNQALGAVVAGGSTGYSAPPIQQQMAEMNQGVQGQSLTQPGFNGYPMYQSQQAGPAATSPVGNTPSLIPTQAREPAGSPGIPGGIQGGQGAVNPWAIMQSSGSGDPFGYPLGASQPPKINVP